MLLLSAFLIPNSAVAAEVVIPPIINYQGKLTDNLGSAVTSGYYEIEFRVWDNATLTGEGHLIWGRSFPLHVMTDGVFNVLLSNDGGAITNPVSPTVSDLRYAFEGTDRYLGLTITHNPLGAVPSPTEISPRQRLVSAPFAFHAQHATYAAAAIAGFAVSGGVTVASGSLQVNGATTLGGGLTISTGQLQVAGATVLGGSLGVAGVTVISNNLKVTGNLVVTNNSTIAGYGTIPIGGIIIWYGATNAIPDGWALCDGGTYFGHQTPDLRDRFVVGAGNSYLVGATGGEATHKLTVPEMPSHNHEYQEGAFESFFGHGAYDKMWRDYDSIHTYTTETGGDQAHENRPPYHALCYIMRVK